MVLKVKGNSKITKQRTVKKVLRENAAIMNLQRDQGRRCAFRISDESSRVTNGEVVEWKRALYSSGAFGSHAASAALGLADLATMRRNLTVQVRQ